MTNLQCSISIGSRKKKIRQLFYILSGSPRQKSWQDVVIPERFQNIQHVQHFYPQRKKEIMHLFYILSGSPKQKSCHDVILPERLWRYSTFSISIRSRKIKLGSCSISFLVHPDKSPGMMLLCLGASKIYNTFSISILQPKKNFRLSFYILSGSPRQKSSHDVIMPERFQDI